jgi:Arylsulfotransferase (ASST)
VFQIQRSTGKILWKLGGKPVNKDGAQILAIQNDQHPTPIMQHDARFLPNGHISIFDNHSLAGPARGVEYALDLANGTATLVAEFPSPIAQTSLAMGSFRRYGDGHSVAGWGVIDSSGDATLLTEFDSAGNDVLDMSFGSGLRSYRAPKAPLARFDRRVLRHTAGSGGWTDTGP